MIYFSLILLPSTLVSSSVLNILPFLQMLIYKAKLNQTNRKKEEEEKTNLNTNKSSKKVRPSHSPLFQRKINYASKMNDVLTPLDHATKQFCKPFS